ncbi:hypothetical protein SAMN04489742_2986 [Arthrobacter crystallopoietes]|uniref:Uncharacterized protein n=1 Tax=Crystallibacter crystallopoietes TaxID=37928 RepID=A0A1H1ELD8_9MICC|nr:hypothetical protein SAMN04489742_2986 [Arthrobacter crystallopoietes]
MWSNHSLMHVVGPRQGPMWELRVLAAVCYGRAEEAAGISCRHIEGYYAEAGMDPGSPGGSML